MDTAILTAITAILTAIIAAIPAYRAGISKNKSIETETAKTLHEITEKHLDRLQSQLSQCATERDSLSRLSRKWRIAFSITRAEMRNAKVNSRVSYALIDNPDTTIAKLQDIRDEISTTYGK